MNITLLVWGMGGLTCGAGVPARRAAADAAEARGDLYALRGGVQRPQNSGGDHHRLPRGLACRKTSFALFFGERADSSRLLDFNGRI